MHFDSPGVGQIVEETRGTRVLGVAASYIALNS